MTTTKTTRTTTEGTWHEEDLVGLCQGGHEEFGPITRACTV